MQDVRRVYIDHIRHHIGHIYALPNSLMSRASADQELIGSDLECAAEQTWDSIIWRMKGWDWREQAVLEQQIPTGIPPCEWALTSILRQWVASVQRRSRRTRPAPCAFRNQLKNLKASYATNQAGGCKIMQSTCRIWETICRIHKTIWRISNKIAQHEPKIYHVQIV